MGTRTYLSADPRDVHLCIARHKHIITNCVNLFIKQGQLSFCLRLEFYVALRAALLSLIHACGLLSTLKYESIAISKFVTTKKPQSSLISVDVDRHPW